VDHPNYQAEAEDIAVEAMLNFQSPFGASYAAQPVFFIRGNTPYNLKAEVPAAGIHARFTRLDPQKGTATILLAKSDLPPIQVPFELATDSFSSNWIVLQAIEFPGINLFWVGTILMMLGLLLAMWVRIRQQKRAIQ
jgi:cytochrome c-type biogenesis protein CcmF